MKPIHLYNGRLRSCLGADLAQASAAYRAGRLPEPQWYKLRELNERRAYLPAPSSGLELEDTLEALAADCLGDSGPFDDVLLVIASTTLDISQMEARVARGEPFHNDLSTSLDRLAEYLRERFDLASAFTINTACTSAANALLYAGRLVAAGDYRRALVIAFETPCQLAMQGFGALGLLSPSGRYRPFHPERDGLILGEAFAAVMLDETPGPRPLARLLGGFSACDTSNLTTTLEDGSHIDWVMRRALESAGRPAEEIALVKPHGTATGANDEAEANGMRRLFPDRAPPSCVLKPYLGHTLGACGLSETLLLLDALQQGALPADDYAAEAMLELPAQPLQLPAGALLLNNFFGFGGNNASLVLQGVAP